MNKNLMIDGKAVRKFLFSRWIVLTQSYFLIDVEAFDKDHAIKRLRDAFPHIEKREWDYLDELDPEHFVGKMGKSLPLYPRAVQ